MMLLIEVTDVDGNEWRINVAQITAVRPIGPGHCELHMPGLAIRLGESADSLCAGIGAVERDSQVEG